MKTQKTMRAGILITLVAALMLTGCSSKEQSKNTSKDSLITFCDAEINPADDFVTTLKRMAEKDVLVFESLTAPARLFDKNGESKTMSSGEYDKSSAGRAIEVFAKRGADFKSEYDIEIYQFWDDSDYGRGWKTAGLFTEKNMLNLKIHGTVAAKLSEETVKDTGVKVAAVDGETWEQSYVELYIDGEKVNLGEFSDGKPEEEAIVRILEQYQESPPFFEAFLPKDLWNLTAGSPSSFTGFAGEALQDERYLNSVILMEKINGYLEKKSNCICVLYYAFGDDGVSGIKICIARRIKGEK